MYNLAFSYREGDGTRRDYGRMLYWFEKSARLGYPPSQNDLGVCSGSEHHEDTLM